MSNVIWSEMPADVRGQVETLLNEMPFEWTQDSFKRIVARAIIAERQRCAAIAEAVAKNTEYSGLQHPEDSESRSRCFARSRTAQKIAEDIQGVE